jgi:Nucleotidyl transferase AbiEii toxin, Type IV TA system
MLCYLTTPGTLAFAGIEPVTVAATPLELHVAEKLHAYTRVYEGSRASTRAKDLVDLALIAELSPLDAARLRSAIDETFAGRGTHTVPDRLPEPPEGWEVPFRQLAEAVGVPTETSEAHAHAAAVIDPILSGEIEQGTWEPKARIWDNG